MRARFAQEPRRTPPPPPRAAPSRLPPAPSQLPPVMIPEELGQRPRNVEDLISDADFADCVELLPELKRLKLRKNNWSFETYQFDEELTESATQKRVYQVVAKPVVESVLSGYNGIVMAYGQTGTGKTYTVGRLGKDDASQRGIMVRAVEDIIASTSPASDSVEVSYLQLYMESIQDLLAPEKVNIPINEDRTGKVSVPGTTIFKIRDLDHFMELLQIGEANRHAANTKLNTESSRSHTILMEKQLENSTYQKVLADTTQMYDKKMSVLMKQLEDERAHCESSEEQLNVMKNLLRDHQKLIEQCDIEKSRYQEALAQTTQMYERKLAELNKQLDDEQLRFESAEEQLLSTQKTLSDSQMSTQQHEVQNSAYQEALADTTQMYERKIAKLIKQLEDEHARVEGAEQQLDLAKELLAEQQNSTQESREIDELRLKLQEMYEQWEDTQTELPH